MPYTFILTDGAGREINGGGSVAQIRRVVFINASGQSVGDGLQTALCAPIDTSKIADLVGYTPTPARFNHTYAWQLSIATPDAPITVNSLSVILTKAFRLGSRWGVALYDSTGTSRLVDTGSLDATLTGQRTISQPGVVLPAGSFWLALTVPPATIYDDPALGSGSPPRAVPGAYHPAVQQTVTENLNSLNYARPTPRAIIAGNVSVNGLCPATLGILTTPQVAESDAALPPWVLLL